MPQPPEFIRNTWGVYNIKGVMTRSMVEFFGVVFPILEGGNSTFIAAIVSGLFPQTEYRSLE